MNAQLEIRKQINELMVQQADLQNKITITQNSDTFNGTLQDRINQLQQVTYVGADAGHVLVGALDTGFKSMEANLTKVIEGTETWRQALLNVAQAIETEVIQSVLTLIGDLVEMEVLELIVKVLSPGGAFAEGGRPTPGELALVGEKGPELWVPDSSGTIIPAHVTEKYLDGHGASPINEPAPSNTGRQVHLHFYDSRPIRAIIWRLARVNTRLSIFRNATRPRSASQHDVRFSKIQCCFDRCLFGTISPGNSEITARREARRPLYRRRQTDGNLAAGIAADAVAVQSRCRGAASPLP